jgi:hypothetical protein
MSSAHNIKLALALQDHALIPTTTSGQSNAEFTLYIYKNGLKLL